MQLKEIISTKSRMRRSLILLGVITIVLFLIFLLYINKPEEPQTKPLWYQWSPYRNEVQIVKKIFYDQIKNVEIKKYGSMLIGVFISPENFQRRLLMRVHQISPFKNYNVTFRFVIGLPDSGIQEDIKYENETYGDIILLDQLVDRTESARFYKPFEFSQYVEKNLGF